jgi:hypothetical protein
VPSTRVLLPDLGWSRVGVVCLFACGPGPSGAKRQMSTDAAATRPHVQTTATRSEAPSGPRSVPGALWAYSTLAFGLFAECMTGELRARPELPPVLASIIIRYSGHPSVVMMKPIQYRKGDDLSSTAGGGGVSS